MSLVSWMKMDVDLATSAVTAEHLPVKETDDSCRFEFIEIVPLTRDTDGSCTTDCVSGDGSGEVKQENLTVVKHEPDDDDECSAVCSVNNDAVTAEADDTLSHKQPHDDALKTHDSPRLQKKYIDVNTGSFMEFSSHAVMVKLEADDGNSSETEADSSEQAQPLEIRIEADSNDVTEYPRGGTSRPYLCTVCDKRFQRRDSLNKHRRTHGGEMISPCSVCNKRFTAAKYLKVHVLRHRDNGVYSCTQCEKRFLCQSSVNHHMHIHTGKYRCAECGKCCKSGSELTVHGRSHSGERPFDCSVCRRRFTTSDQLVVHGRVHSGEKPYRCHLCTKAFSRWGSLQQHKRVHTGDKPYTCSQCKKRFSHSSHMNQHERRVHSNRRPYACYCCGKLFVTNQDLKRHVHIHTTPKPYSCRHCSDSFRRLDQLKRHLLKSHNEGTWFTCDICQKKFASRSDLKQHVRRHEAVKPYVCSECPQRFRTAEELKLHHSVHS